MRVLILNTSEKTGGAAVAAGRLMDALNNNGVKARMLVRDKQTSRITVAGLPRPLSQQWHFLWERWVVFCHLHFSKRHLFEIDIANAGADITRMREFKEADVIHIHWINQGFLSLRGIRKILDSGKPVVWTMHDVWPATAICHYTRGCAHFKSRCHSCRLLPGDGGENDLSSRIWEGKRRMLNGRNVHFVTCSRWLEGEAGQSALIAGHPITSIPNPIDTHVFMRGDKRKARMASSLPLDKKVILFVSQKVTDARKGMEFFVGAMERMVESCPEMRETTVVAVLGGHAEDVVARLPLKACPLGYVSDERRIAAIYNAADVFVLPSLEDNLPNTVMEAMACGVPCVGFEVGGIPEMIDHLENGYVAKFRDVADLAEGIRWVLGGGGGVRLSDNCLRKVAAAYSQRSVALRYIDVYNKALALSRNKI